MKRIIYLLSLLGAFGGHRQSVEALRTEEGASVGWGHVKQIPFKYPKTSGVSLVALILCAWCVVSYLNAPPSLTNDEIEDLLHTTLIELENAVYNKSNTQEELKKEVIRILTTYKNNFEQEDSADINLEIRDKGRDRITNIFLFSITYKQKDILNQLLAMDASLHFYEDTYYSVFLEVEENYDKNEKETKQLKKRLIEKFKQTYPKKTQPEAVDDEDWSQS